MIKQPFSTELALIYLILFVVGIGYNLLVAAWERKKYIEGYTALAVVLGVSVTLAPFWFFPAVPIWQIYLAFVCTGSPMIFGSILRHVHARRNEQKDLMNERPAAPLA